MIIRREWQPTKAQVASSPAQRFRSSLQTHHQYATIRLPNQVRNSGA
jgi:hypothetical protein